MDQDNNIPLLLRFYFGDSAATAQGGASRRLKKWSRAFGQWMDERKTGNQKNAVKQARIAWRRLVRHIGKMPWQITQQDIEQHLVWMEQEGFARSTINPTLGIIRGFYRWCDDHRVDPACSLGFNPAGRVKRIKYSYYEGACIWTRDEVRVFLDFLKRDGSELGKREYAYFLARINLGVNLNCLQQLKWDQFQLDESGVWVRWGADGEQVKLPDEVWQAIREYLQVSGRLEGMQPGKYIFVPLSRPNSGDTGARAKDWLEHHQLSYSAILANLKIYGRKLGIAEEKLTFLALRRTAIRFKLEDGESVEAIKSFTGSRVNLTQVKSRQSRLLEIPQESLTGCNTPASDIELPHRRANILNGLENITHGFFCHKQDKDAVKAVLKENIHGMQAEIECLRTLMRGLMEGEEDEAHLAEAYSKAAQRLAMLLATEGPAEKGKKNSWAEEFLERMDEICRSQGESPFSPGVLEEVYGSPSGDIGARGMVAEEVATCRLLLRNVYRRAMQGVGADEYVRLVDLYGMVCVRLARLIKIGGGDGDDRLTKYLDDMLDEALCQITLELGFDKEN